MWAIIPETIFFERRYRKIDAYNFAHIAQFFQIFENLVDKSKKCANKIVSRLFMNGFRRGLVRCDQWGLFLLDLTSNAMWAVMSETMLFDVGITQDLLRRTYGGKVAASIATNRTWIGRELAELSKKYGCYNDGLYMWPINVVIGRCMQRVSD
jgi:hypothetical protein